MCNQTWQPQDSRSCILGPSSPCGFGNWAKLVPMRPRGPTLGGILTDSGYDTIH